MPLRIRILLWVSSLFLITIFFVFVISDYEINHSLKKEESALISKIKQVDKQNSENILRFLGININNSAEKMYNAFEALRTSSQWRQRFLPNKYTIETKNWGSTAAVLATYPWLDLMNVEINGELGAYIHQAAPYLRKYVQVPIAEDLIIFITEREKGILTAYVGVPFWKNQVMKKYIDDTNFPDFFLTNSPNQWLLYDVEELLALDTDTMTMKNNQLYKHLFDEAITIHTQQEYNFLIDTTKIMLNITKNKLLKQKALISTLTNQKNHQEFLERKIKEIDPEIAYQRDYCTGPLCNFTNFYKDPQWATRRNFQNKLTQKKLIWELCMLTRTGIWDYSPFAPGAPAGVVTALEPTTQDKRPKFFNHVVEGFFKEDVFIDKTINIPRKCTLRVGDAKYDKKILFKGKKDGIAKSCKNCCLSILFDKDLKEPYLTSTNYISFQQPPMKTENIAAITFGEELDTILTNLALVSPDEIAFIFGKNIRLYTTDGRIINISDDHSDENRMKLITEKEGSLIDKYGHKIYFTHLTQITEDGGDIVLIEKEESRTTIIDEINRHVKGLTHRVIIHSSILIIASLIIIMLILNRVINAITKPINKLAEVTGHVTTRKLDSIVIDEKQAKRKDEIGTLYSSFAEMIQSMKEGNKVRGILDKVVSKEVAEKIVREGITLGGEKRHLTVMFCDIRNFTAITEKMDPVDVLIMLNECLTLLSGIIDDFEGVIDKYEGDKIMTLFGAPLDTPNHPLQAVLCALEMQKALIIWNEQRERTGLCKLEVGIGIHTGEAVAGNVGAENHLSYTVLGHFVNVSARLCDFAKAREILITKETLKGAKEHINYHENPPQHFKGITDPITTFSVTKKKSK